MPKHYSVIAIPEGHVRSPIIDLSENENARSITEWLKKNFKQKATITGLRNEIQSEAPW